MRARQNGNEDVRATINKKLEEFGIEIAPKQEEGGDGPAGAPKR